MNGWVLVPVIPTERMLTEFAGVWAPWLPKARRDLELKAYADMLAVVPTPPTERTDEVELLRQQVKRLEKALGRSKAETRKAYKKLEYVWRKYHTLQCELEAKPCES